MAFCKPVLGGAPNMCVHLSGGGGGLFCFLDRTQGCESVLSVCFMLKADEREFTAVQFFSFSFFFFLGRHPLSEELKRYCRKVNKGNK